MPKRSLQSWKIQIGNTYGPYEVVLDEEEKISKEYPLPLDPLEKQVESIRRLKKLLKIVTSLLATSLSLIIFILSARETKGLPKHLLLTPVPESKRLSHHSFCPSH
jgi:hypothetical protein